MRLLALCHSSTAFNALSIGFTRAAFDRAIIISGRSLGLIKYRR